ncbi:ABC transporter substrate-binding protein [Frankia sp. CNm7]|uniref:ABC transporter substrate-binding protein n=1 Tax=Frankia nepalensis TaxID=1836974 RepID=A0A937UU07_9ACTN|nr:ABC transporter substrate-binding protein [Frankia nepalensis]MBL7500272.1 ABC transporter substrate-binding protein [Frankia nepalensis]MBL7511973.1 ABC transporter substrate-binding protein [Frankia nepalensis]MBL7522643.1 ABC transporter substrate-binding protein [Frankia nepalensis]MBL7631785.1 ABC transporter substrate-binding protein [Frankia nepalensis]
MKNMSISLAARPDPNRRPVGRRLSVLSVVTAGLLFAAGCGGSGQDESESAPPSAGSTTDVLGPVAPAKGDPVKIGVISDGKSPINDLTVELQVADATAKWLNDRRSGIGGRPIQLVKCEALADPAKTTDCANRMIEEDVAAVVVGLTAASENLWQPLHDAKVPVMLYAGNGGAMLRDSESTFILADPIFPRITLPIQLAKENGLKKVTAIIIDVPAALDIYKTVAPEQFRAAGIELKLVPVPPGTADMAPQMQTIGDDPGLVYVLGNDSFCISALNGLRAIGFTGEVSGVSQCISDATREAVPGDVLDGMVIAATAPLGTDNPSSRLYKAVAQSYGTDIDTTLPGGISMFISLAGFQTAVEDIQGEITSASIAAAIKAMPEKELPGAGGLEFRCNGKASPTSPAICVRGGLVTTLDAKGQPKEYDVLGSSPIDD